MGLTLDRLRQKAAKGLMVALWLHLLVVFFLAKLAKVDPLAPTALVAVLSAFASAVALRRSLDSLSAVLVAVCFAGSVCVLAGLLAATPWQATVPVYVTIAMALTLPLGSGAAVLAFGGLVLVKDLGVMGLDLVRMGDLSPIRVDILIPAGLTALQAGALAAIAKALARVLQTAQAKAAAAQAEVDSLWYDRTNAQIQQAQFIAALMERITDLAKNPINPPLTSASFPFAFAQVEWAFDVLAQKLQQGVGLADPSGLTKIDLANATAQLAGCLHDQSSRLKVILQAAQGDYRAKVAHKMRLDLADAAELAQQTAVFAADLSHRAAPLPSWSGKGHELKTA